MADWINEVNQGFANSPWLGEVVMMRPTIEADTVVQHRRHKAYEHDRELVARAQAHLRAYRRHCGWNVLDELGLPPDAETVLTTLDAVIMPACEECGSTLHPWNLCPNMKINPWRRISHHRSHMGA